MAVNHNKSSADIVAVGNEIRNKVLGGIAKVIEPPFSQTGLDWRTVYLYASGNLGAGVYYGFSTVVLPLFLNGLLAPAWLIGILSSARAFEGTIIQPLIGTWSDRTWTKFGRRRPFIIACLPIAVVFLFFTPVAAQAGNLGRLLGWNPTSTALVSATFSIFLFSFAFSVMYNPYLSLLADLFPTRRRGTVNGILQLFTNGGQILLILMFAFFAFLKFELNSLFFVTGFFLLLFFLPTVIGLREPRTLPGNQRKQGMTWRDYWKQIRSNHPVQLYFLSQSALWFGINGIQPFLTLYVIKIVKIPQSQAVLYLLGSLIVTALLVSPAGTLSDQIGLKRVFIGGMVLLIIAAILGSFIINPILLIFILGIVGMGNAAHTATSYPMLVRLVPSYRVGLFTGLNSMVVGLASLLAGTIAGTLISLFSFKIIFPFFAIMCAGAIVPLLFMQLEEPWQKKLTLRRTRQQLSSN